MRARAIVCAECILYKYIVLFQTIYIGTYILPTLNLYENVYTLDGGDDDDDGFMCSEIQQRAEKRKRKIFLYILRSNEVGSIYSAYTKQHSHSF